MINEIREALLGQRGIDSFQRIAGDYPLPFYVGLDSSARYALFCITGNAPTVSVVSSTIISAFVGRRQDGTYGITFSLADAAYFDHFLYFCSDLVSYSSRLVDSVQAANQICNRYTQWQKAFARAGQELLSPAEIKGLLGELCFLHAKMIPLYGEQIALSSWCGPEMADRDFECPDTWYEVKSTVSGYGSVKISSIEQLDTPRDGHLVVVYLDKTSHQDGERITLNSFFHLLRNSFSSVELQEQFEAILLTFGYYERPEYDNFNYKYQGMEIYSIDASFPCVRRNSIPVAVQNLKYELSLSAIAGFREE